METVDRTSASADLWHRYRATGDPHARDQLVGGNLGLVHRAARAAIQAGVRTIELGDLVGAGTVGLIQAIEGFDPSRGFAFSTYAMPRIRGAILDELQGQSWVPRSVRERRRLIARAQERLQQRLGADPAPSHLAEALGIDLATFWRWWGEARRCTVLALDHPGDDSCPDAVRLLDLIPDPDAVKPDEALAHAQLLERMRQVLETLPERNRLVLVLYYYEGLTLREIGSILRVSESRVCQIHARALRALRAHIAI